MASPAADIFRQAADANRRDPRRRGNVVHLEPGREVIVAGDVHGHRANLAKVISGAALGEHPDRRLVLQEIVHGPVDPRSGHDRSIDLLLRAARLKLAHPQQVLFVLANHDLAQVTGNEITKEGAGVCRGFSDGVRYAFGDDADEVLAAVDEFLLSAPLAIRSPNGVLISHTLPSPGRECDLPDGEYADADLRRGGPVYEWTWGRRHTPEFLERLAGRMDVELFVLGHVHLDGGYELIDGRAVILNCDNPGAVVFRFTTDEAMPPASLESHLAPVTSLTAAG